MNGNFTLKSIFPIINPLQNFEELVIQSGVTAMYSYESLKEDLNPLERENVIQDLIHYCEMDASATFQLFCYLQS
jgi:hypothetical protein